MLREIRMLGPGWGVVKANVAVVALLSCVLVAGGCFWRTYPGRLTVHTEVLVGVARKARDLVVTGRFSAENVPELSYPLERAQGFAADAVRRRPVGHDAPPSLDAFLELLRVYRAYIDDVDRVRRGETGGEPAAALAAPLAAVEEAARKVVYALAHEQRP